MYFKCPDDGETSEGNQKERNKNKNVLKNIAMCGK